MYYVELYDAKGTKAKWWKGNQSFSDVLYYLSVRQTGEILRIMADVNAPKEQLSKLIDMGARSY